MERRELQFGVLVMMAFVCVRGIGTSCKRDFEWSIWLAVLASSLPRLGNGYRKVLFFHRSLSLEVWSGFAYVLNLDEEHGGR